MMRKPLIVPIALAALVSAGGLAYAEQRGGDGHDAAALAGAKITLQQAIATAEQQAGGKAVGAGVDRENGVVRIAVDVAGAQGVKTVLVDPQSGQVTATRDGGQDEQDQD